MTYQQHQALTLINQLTAGQLESAVAYLQRLCASTHSAEKDAPSQDRQRRRLAFQRLQVLRDKMAAMNVDCGDMDAARKEAMREKHGE